METAPAVLLRDLTFAYPKRGVVLAIPELRIATGEDVFLHGPSGCGKSTLLSVIAGVLQRGSGQLQVLGHDFGAMSPAARDRVRGVSMGYVFQNFNLVPYLTVQQNIELPCRLFRARLARIRESTLESEVQRLGRRLAIADTLRARVGELSVGQQQRAAIARALIGSPPLLIADEPTSALDAERRDGFIALLLELLQEGRSPGRPTTLLYVSHDAALAGRFARQVSLPALNRAVGGDADAAA